MKIDKYTKQSIVRAIMADVPKPDKKKRLADLQVAIDKAMSPEVRKVYKTKPEALRTRHFGSLVSDFGVAALIVGDVNEETLKAMTKPYETEDHARREAEYKLESVIATCNTLKQLNDRLPEFKKYFPTEAAPLPKSLPALANVVADLSKLGWPKK